MTILRRTLRIVRNLFFFALIALCIALLVIVQIEQRMMRADAERLHADILSLTILKTSGADALRILSHWRGKLERTGNCEEGHCELTVREENWVAGRRFLINRQWFGMNYHRIGGRFATFNGEVRIENGAVSEISFFLGLENIAPPDRNGQSHYYHRGGLIRTLSSFGGYEIPNCDMEIQQHPEYCISSPYDCVKCAFEYVYFTPFAPASDVARITQINFYCMTRWSACEKIADVFPSAAADFLAQESTYERLASAYTDEAMSSWMQQPWLHAREMENAVIVEVVSIGQIPMPPGYTSTKPYPGAKLRLIEKLKGAKDWSSAELRNLYVGKNHLIGPPETYTSMHAGQRFIVLFGSDPYNGGPLDGVYFAVWPLNDLNLAQVKLGISRDYLDRYPVMQ